MATIEIRVCRQAGVFDPEADRIMRELIWATRSHDSRVGPVQIDRVFKIELNEKDPARIKTFVERASALLANSAYETAVVQTPADSKSD